MTTTTNALPEFRRHGFDSKFVPLTAEQAAQPTKGTLDFVAFVERWASRPLAGLKLLDVGCGRGDLVGFLRSRGTRAFGIDIDARFVEAGRAMCSAYRDEHPILSTVERNGRSRFPVDYFDIVVSNQVLEHVADLGGVVRETARVLRPGGLTCHQFPARYRLVEPHYMLPFVHWLPKSNARRIAIKALLAAGLARQFFADLSLAARTEIVFKYSVDETFYRPVACISKVFASHGLEPTFRDGMHAYIETRLHRNVAFRTPLIDLVAAFRMVMFTARKRALE